MSDNINPVIRELNLTAMVKAIGSKEMEPHAAIAALCTAIVSTEDHHQTRMRYHDGRYASFTAEVDRRVAEVDRRVAEIRQIVFDMRDAQRRRDTWIIASVGTVLIAAIMRTVIGP